MVTTRWVDKTNYSFKEIIDKMSEVPADENNNSMSYCNWNIEKVFEENQKEKLNGKELEYNYFKYKYDSISYGNQPIEDRTAKNEGIVIVYYDGKYTNYIISRNSDAQKIIRKIMNYTGKNEIDRNMPSFDTDFFIWLINKVYNNENTIEAINKDLYDISLDAIKGFKGNTEDLLTKVSANGESVMNIISTLSFFLESRNLNQITLDMEYFKHQSITLVLTNKGFSGTVSIYEDKYQGIFEEEIDKNIILPKLTLLVYLEILPILIQAYNNDIENEVWSREENINFLKKVAKELSEKVKNRVEFLETME
ncbi:hypothetical protein [Parvimonas micra]|nr:hypothetical protein [Parvimonas micra]